MGGNYSFELKPIETQAPQVFGHNDSFLGGVLLHQNVREDVSRKLLHCKLLSVFASYLTDGIFETDANFVSFLFYYHCIRSTY